MGKALPSFFSSPPARKTGDTVQGLDGREASPATWRGTARENLAQKEALAWPHRQLPGLGHYRQLARPEEAFWSMAFSHEPYYVPGRSYDQYHPAYVLGWQAAFHYSATEFAALERLLEQAWSAHETGSLLDWNQVRPAAEAAWLRGKTCLLQGGAAAEEAQKALQLGRLRGQLLLAADELQMLLQQVDSPPAAFVHQVLERHVHILTEQGRALPAGKTETGWAWWHQLVQGLRRGRMQLRAWLRECDLPQLLQRCDGLEAQLLERYQGLLAQPLAPQLRNLLERQAHQLLQHHDKLRWLRQHW